MEPLWKSVTPEMAEQLLNQAAFAYAVEDNVHYMVTLTTIRDIICTYVEQNMESYELKKTTS